MHDPLVFCASPGKRESVFNDSRSEPSRRLPHPRGESTHGQLHLVRHSSRNDSLPRVFTQCESRECIWFVSASIVLIDCAFSGQPSVIYHLQINKIGSNSVSASPQLPSVNTGVGKMIYTWEINNLLQTLCMLEAWTRLKSATTISWARNPNACMCKCVAKGATLSACDAAPSWQWDCQNCLWSVFFHYISVWYKLVKTLKSVSQFYRKAACLYNASVLNNHRKKKKKLSNWFNMIKTNLEYF